MHVLGSRAVVMECQYGPRRKGNPYKKVENSSGDYKLTCPARLVQQYAVSFMTFFLSSSNVSTIVMLWAIYMYQVGL
jgi:hypothetical protein